MNYNTQNAKIASITEKSLIVGIDVGSETHYARAFDWRNYEYSKKPFAFNNIARQVEGKIAYRRAIKMAIANTMRMGAEGIKIQISGRLNGAEMARSEMYKEVFPSQDQTGR